VGYVIGYDLTIGYYLYRKLARYRDAYLTVSEDNADAPRPELTEFEPPQR